MPINPTARHSGAFTFTRRRPLPTLPKTVGPARYDPSLEPTTSRKPAWGFGSEIRGQVHVPRLTPRSGSARGRNIGESRYMPSPGPSSYDVRPTYSAPRYSMRPRRVLHIHPGTQPPSD